MQEKIITIYCLCADFLDSYGYQDDPQAQLITSEVMTVAGARLLSSSATIRTQSLPHRAGICHHRIR